MSEIIQFPAITLHTAGLLGLIFLVLSVRVVQARLSQRISLGDGGGESVIGNAAPTNPLLVRARSHANFAEYAPICLLLLGLVEMSGRTSGWFLWGVASALVVARIAHPIGMARPAPNAWRLVGTLLQFTVLAVLSGVAIYVVAA
jgi:uncharacterized protein